MRLLELMLLYGLVGLGCALVVIAMSGAPAASRAIDALLLLLFWPLFGPFLLARGAAHADPSAKRELSFLLALRNAAGTPLASLLPDEKTARELARRLRVAAGKIEEIDALLERSEFDEHKAVARHRELRERGASECALSTAGIRIQNIRRLRGLRDRFARELDEVGELIAQLTTQAEVLRLAGAPSSETRYLVEELVSRVEGLDQMLDDDPSTPASGELAGAADAGVT